MYKVLMVKDEPVRPEASKKVWCKNNGIVGEIS